MNTTLRRRIAEWADAHRAQQQAFLAELVRVPSDNPPGDCAPHALRTRELLQELGLEVEAYPVPEEAARAHGMRSVTNLVVRKRFGEGPVIALNAHGDAVPPGEGWSVDPYAAEVRDGALHGRGAAVSKSDFACYTFALLALSEVAPPERGTVELHLTYDEEAGGHLGPAWLLEQGLVHPDLAICAGFSYQVVTAHNGCLHLEVTLHGSSAHAAEPERGADALEAATLVLGALYAHRKSYAAVRSAVPGIGSPSLVVGVIAGGINTNVVPDRVSFRLDRRMIPEEVPARAEAELVSFIERTAAIIPGIRCEVRRVLLAEPLKPLPGAEALIEALRGEAALVLEQPVATGGVPLYTDARHYAAAGIPTVLYGAGPRTLAEAGAHGPDERVLLEDLSRATRVVAQTLGRLLGA